MRGVSAETVKEKKENYDYTLERNGFFLSSIAQLSNPIGIAAVIT